jgi:hypothetical protein
MIIAHDSCKPGPQLLVFFYAVLAVPIVTPQMVYTVRDQAAPLALQSHGVCNDSV